MGKLMQEFITNEEAQARPDRLTARLQKSYLNYVDKFHGWTKDKRQTAMKEILELKLACQGINVRCIEFTS